MRPLENRVIIIDDDSLNNFLCKRILWLVNPSLTIIEFTSAEEGLAYIQKDCNESSILLLDLNMPVMNGWDFLEQFDALPDNMKCTITIYVVSSSIDESDFERAKSNNNISGYIMKPLTAAKLSMLSPH